MNTSNLTSQQNLRRKLLLAWSVYWVAFILFVAAASFGGKSSVFIVLAAFFGVAVWLAAVVSDAATNSGKTGAVWGLGTFFLGPVGALFLPAAILLALRKS